MKLNPNHPALHEKRTIHPSRVMPVKDDSRLLKPASENRKLGNGNSVIFKGKWRGFPLYSLTLQERATCPKTCDHWDDCYGNGMLFAHRFDHGPKLVAKLESELEELARKYPKGFAVRLHVLGDFYSIAYVNFWQMAMIRFPNLHIYGYTARLPNTAIGKSVAFVRVMFPDRWWIRYSSNEVSDDAIFATSNPIPGAITCPEMEGKTESCLTCGLCWSVTKSIYFPTHTKNRKPKELTNGS